MSLSFAVPAEAGTQGVRRLHPCVVDGWDGGSHHAWGHDPRPAPKVAP